MPLALRKKLPHSMPVLMTSSATVFKEKNGGFSIFSLFVHIMHKIRTDLAPNAKSYFISIAHGGLPKADDYHRDIYEGSGCQ